MSASEFIGKEVEITWTDINGEDQSVVGILERITFEACGQCGAPDRVEVVILDWGYGVYTNARNFKIKEHVPPEEFGAMEDAP